MLEEYVEWEESLVVFADLCVKMVFETGYELAAAD